MKKVNKPTITIGIAAFNEEGNIAFLIRQLLLQKRRNFVLDKILVASDGSNDNTNQLVKKFKNKRVQLIKGKNRKGVSYRQNQIIKLTDSDILVLLDADILPKGLNFLEKLITPIIEKNIDLTSASMEELKGNFLENILSVSMNLKESVFANYKQGNNIYTCHGPARALSKNLYSKIYFKYSIGQDGYTYLFCHFNGMKYQYVQSASLIYKSPSTLSDYKKQSIRFAASIRNHETIFGKDFIRKEFEFPKKLMLINYLKFLFKYPVQMFCYTFLQLYLKGSYILGTQKVPDTWEMVRSSKVIQTT